MKKIQRTAGLWLVIICPIKQEDMRFKVIFVYKFFMNINLFKSKSKSDTSSVLACLVWRNVECTNVLNRCSPWNWYLTTERGQQQQQPHKKGVRSPMRNSCGCFFWQYLRRDQNAVLWFCTRFLLNSSILHNQMVFLVFILPQITSESDWCRCVPMPTYTQQQIPMWIHIILHFRVVYRLALI